MEDTFIDIQRVLTGSLIVLKDCINNVGVFAYILIPCLTVYQSYAFWLSWADVF